MLFPVILMIYFFLINIGIFQYERCVAEQSLCYALLRSKETYFLEQEERQLFLKEAYASVASQRSINEGWENKGFEVKGDRVLGIVESKNGIYISKEIKMLSPVEFIRLCNKLKGIEIWNLWKE